MENNAFSESLGALKIPKDRVKAKGADRFAIFPTYEHGRKAKATMLFTGKNYKGISLTAAISRYAPAFENNTTGYQNKVLAAVGGLNKVMSQYTPDEQNAILNAMEKVEGYKPGKVIKMSAATNPTTPATTPIAQNKPATPNTNSFSVVS